MFLVHTGRVVNMSIDLSDIVEITKRSALVIFVKSLSSPMRYSLVCQLSNHTVRLAHLHIRKLLILVQQAVQAPLASQVLQSPESKTLRRSIRAYSKQKVEVGEILFQTRDMLDLLFPLC